MAYALKTIKNEDLDSWVKNGQNVLMAGLHGVGKTAMIKDAFERNGLKWRYFSAATMDPWTDFVGVPKERTNEDGESYLDFILPKEFADDDVEALFFDEFNRAPKKVRNAVMELMQFKSINGRQFKNLKVIWAAVNPKDAEDMDFDVDDIDPAQEDRFHVHVEIPYKPSYSYFVDVYGEDMAKAATDWWNSLDKDIKNMVSPRRLDYALACFQSAGDMRYVLPREANTSALYQKLQHGAPEKTLRKHIAANDKTAARQFLSHPQNLNALKSLITDDDAIRKFCLPLIHAERLVTLLTKSKEIKDEIFANPHEYEDVITDLANGSQNQRIKKRCKDLLGVIERTRGKEGSITDMIPINELPVACPKWERTHFATNFEIKDDYDVTDSEEYGDNIDDRLKELVHTSMTAKNTYFRNQLYKGILELTSEHLTAEQAKISLKLLDWYVSNTNSSNLQDKPDLPVIFNTCYNCIQSEEGNFDAAKLYQLAPYTFYKMFSEKSGASLTKKYINLFCFQEKAEADQVSCRQKDQTLEEIDI